MKSTTKILSLLLTFMLFLTFSVSADAYDILFSDIHSGTIEMTASLKCENLDFINEIPDLAEGQTFLDGKLFFEGVFETAMNCKIDFSLNNDYTDIDFAMTMDMNLPVKLNNNLIADTRMKLGVWGIYDVTDSDNPVAKLILSTPVSSKYIIVDIVEELSLRGMEYGTITDACKKVVNKEKISEFINEYKEIYKNNSNLAKNGKKNVITVSETQFKELTKQLAKRFYETFKSVNPELADMDSEAFEADLEELNEVFSASSEIEVVSGRNDVIEECNMTTSMTFNIPSGEDETVALDFDVIEVAKYSNINKAVKVDFPSLTEDNSCYHYEASGYSYSSYFDYVYVCCDYVPAAENTVYVPLNTFVTSLREKGSTYSLSVKNGVVTFEDTSDCEQLFNTVQFRANSPVYTVDSQEYTAPNPVIITDSGIYVDNTVVNKIFGMYMNYAETDLMSNQTSASFEREFYPEGENPYEEEYYQEYDDEYYDCDHYQHMWFEMTYDGSDTNSYFPLRDVADGYVYANDNGQMFDITYDNGVVTITETSGTDTLQSAMVTVGSNVITVNGIDYTTDLPAINYGGKVYVDQSAVKALLGFELNGIDLIYELSEEDSSVITKTTKSASFYRKNPKCTHDVDYY